MAKRPYHHGNLRAALLAAGRQALEANGPASLSLRGLARAAGVAAPSVYNHFASLEALTLALAEEGFSEIGAALSGAGQDPMSVGLAYLGFARCNPGLYRLMFGEGRRNDSPEGAILRARRQAAFAPLMVLVGSRENGAPSLGAGPWSCLTRDRRPHPARPGPRSPPKRNPRGRLTWKRAAAPISWFTIAETGPLRKRMHRQSLVRRQHEGGLAL